MIVKKTPEQIDRMAAAGDILIRTLELVEGKIRPGVTTLELDEAAERFIRSHGAEPAFKGYSVAGRVYPATLCVSINEEVVHGMPSPRRVLAEGDIVGLDFGVVRKGYYGDGALTVGVERA